MELPKIDTAADLTTEDVVETRAKAVMPAMVGGQVVTGKAYKEISRMHDAKGAFIPERNVALVVGNSAEGTVYLKKRRIDPGRGSSLRKLQRAHRIAEGEAGTKFVNPNLVERPHVHPRSKRVTTAAE